MPTDGESISREKKKEAAALEAFARRVELLRMSHERFFMGIEKIPPTIERQKLERDLRNSPLMRSRNTALRFRFNNTRQRLASYARYWDRIFRLIEEGKFRRDRNALAGTGAPAGEPLVASEKTKKPDENIREVFEAWQAAHKSVGKSTNTDFKSFSTKLKAQRDRQLEAKGWKDVAFDVKVKDGKVRLVGKPVKGERSER